MAILAICLFAVLSRAAQQQDPKPVTVRIPTGPNGADIVEAYFPNFDEVKGADLRKRLRDSREGIWTPLCRPTDETPIYDDHDLRKSAVYDPDTKEVTLISPISFYVRGLDPARPEDVKEFYGCPSMIFSQIQYMMIKTLPKGVFLNKWFAVDQRIDAEKAFSAAKPLKVTVTVRGERRVHGAPSAQAHPHGGSTNGPHPRRPHQ